MPRTQPHSYIGYSKYGCRCDVCLEGYRQRKEYINTRRRRLRITPAVIDGSPLAAIWKQQFKITGSNAKLVAKWETIGIDIYEADRYCTSIGKHPMEVFGDAYFTGIEDERRKYIEIYGVDPTETGMA